MKPEDKETIKRERQAYNDETCRNRSEIQELRSQVQDLGGTVVTQHPPPLYNFSLSQRSQVSQLTTTNNSIMGGRNEQVHNRQVRRAGAVVLQRHVQSSTPIPSWTDPPENTTAENECDTNVDTCCLGKNFVVLTASFDDPISGETYILVFNESLYYGNKLDHTLINLYQLRAYGIPLWDNRFDPMHSLSIEVNPTLTISLRAFGTKVGFCTRVPMTNELRTWLKRRLKAEVDLGSDHKNPRMSSTIDQNTLMPKLTRRFYIQLIHHLSIQQNEDNTNNATCHKSRPTTISLTPQYAAFS